MPEGDSVYQLAARLRPPLDGHTLTGGEIRGGGAAGTKVGGWRVVEHDTHGKHLLTRFDSGLTLHTHLRMQGSWTVSTKGRTLPRHVLPDVRSGSSPTPEPRCGAWTCPSSTSFPRAPNRASSDTSGPIRSAPTGTPTKPWHDWMLNRTGP
ncbi:DNA-formamidopyrimidine glycosylase family protein [Frondihabitans cladoniiphilus]|uniref:DNA-formamidopyrimidine glycosylase family protein n=1 Tax=Frondihabitans cladoniiphilus TaxID=715785 RepID=UPI0031E7FAFE